MGWVGRIFLRRGQAFAGKCSIVGKRARKNRKRERGGGAEVERRGRRDLVQSPQRKPAAERAVKPGDAERKRFAGAPPNALRLDRRHSAPERRQGFARVVRGHARLIRCSLFVLIRFRKSGSESRRTMTG